MAEPRRSLLVGRLYPSSGRTRLLHLKSIADSLRGVGAETGLDQEGL